MARTYVFSDDQTWFSLWNLSEAAHITVVSLLNIALANAPRLKVLPVITEQNIGSETLYAESVPQITNRYLMKLEEPSDVEVALVSSTLRTVLSFQAVPPTVYETVKKALDATVDMLCDYSSTCATPTDVVHQTHEWKQDDITCQTFGMLPAYPQVQDDVAEFNSEAQEYYKVWAQ